MIVLDASVLISAMHPRDAHGASAARIIRAHREPGELMIHPVNLAEALVRAVQSGQEDRARRIVDLLDLRLAPADDEAPWRWASLRAGASLRMPDCCALDAAHQAGAALATFDDRLASAARNAGVDVIAR